METIKELIKEGLALRDDIYPTLADDGESFIYHLDDINHFLSWSKKVLDITNQNETFKDLTEKFVNTESPIYLGTMLNKLIYLAGGKNTNVSPLAPRSTDF